MINIRLFLVLTFTILFTKNNFAQSSTLPYLKSCIDIEDVEQRQKCTEEKLTELIRAEFEKTQKFEKAEEDLNIELELSISERGIIRIANYNCIHKIEATLLEAITNIGYRVVMKPALKNDKKIDAKVKYDIKIKNFLPKGKSRRISMATTTDSREKIPPTYNVNTTKVFKVVEKMPSYPGCEDSKYTKKEKRDCSNKLMLDYLYSNLKPTQNGYDQDIEGMFVVQFVVNEDGSLSDFDFTRKLENCNQCIDRMTEVLISMPAWIPGSEKDKSVKVLYTLPIKYKKQ